jgi:hypothetical protein
MTNDTAQVGATAIKWLGVESPEVTKALALVTIYNAEKNEITKQFDDAVKRAREIADVAMKTLQEKTQKELTSP